jgi:hypothetical protein
VEGVFRKRARLSVDCPILSVGALTAALPAHLQDEELEQLHRDRVQQMKARPRRHTAQACVPSLLTHFAPCSARRRSERRWR